MCGICGIFLLDPGAEPERHQLQQMNRTMTHRGPDDEGYYVSGPVGLAMRRLSIIDLSGGRQPIANEDETIWIVFNGEIYNYPELRSELVSKGHQFRTRSDTEVIVHLYEEMGKDCVTRLNGMFALRTLGFQAAPPFPGPGSARDQTALLLIRTRPSVLFRQ